MGKYVAVIAVRAGSKRLKNKNILPFGDSNLLVHKIRQLKKVEQLDEIIVSSDSELMLEMAQKEGVKIQKRPLEYADEKSRTFGECVEWIVDNLDADHIVWCPCVSPMSDEHIYRQALRFYKEFVLFSEYYDSLVTAKLIREYLWDKKGPLNYTLQRHVPSQQLPYWVAIVNCCFIASKECILKNRFCYGNSPYIYEIDKISAIDIDDEFDLEFARVMYNYKIAKQGEKND